MSTKTLQILNTARFILMITMNTLANALPINGLTTGVISDRYPNLFVPAGFTFGIWGVIYLLLLAFVIYQARSWWQKETQVVVVQEIGIWFFISCLANACWIIAWHYLQVELSFLLMLTLLTCLIVIYRRLQIGQIADSPTYKFLAQLPFSVYLGWITVATIANFTALLVHWEHSGFWLGETIWTILMILTATAFGIFFVLKRQDVPYTLVLIWALIGITAARQNSTILLISYLGIAILGILALFRFSRWVKSKNIPQ